jgi:predicted RNA-binding Zn ribbon-like protein
MDATLDWPEPGGRDPAPATDLHLLQDFVNTNDVESDRDALGTPALLRNWLVDGGFVPADTPVDAATHQRAIAMREGLRALGRANNGEPLDIGQLEALNRAAAEVPVSVGVRPDSWRLAPAAPGADAFLGRILATLVRAMADGTWSRVKACRNDTCRWLFYDQSRNRSGTWCTMAICGSRMKSRAYRSRRRSAGA